MKDKKLIAFMVVMSVGYGVMSFLVFTGYWG